MSDLVNKIKDVIHSVNDKYHIEISFVESKGNSIPNVLDKDFIVYDHENLSTDFVKDPKKATCFDFTLGMLIVNRLKEEFLGDPNIHINLISLADAHFINDIDSTIKNAANLALSPDEKAKMDIVESKTKDLHDKISRVQGLISVGPVITLGNTSKQLTIEIKVVNIDAKAKLFTLKNDETQIPFLKIDTDGTVSYEGVPVKIVVIPTKTHE